MNPKNQQRIDSAKAAWKATKTRAIELKDGVLVMIDDLGTPRKGVVAGMFIGCILTLVVMLLGILAASGISSLMEDTPIVKVEAPARPNVNVVSDITPVRAATARQQDILNSLVGKPHAEQDKILQEQWPTLATDLIGWLRALGEIQNDEAIEKVELFYGSTTADGADVDGEIHTGHFNEELLAEITVTGRENPLLIAVRCTNGMFNVVRGALHPVGVRSLEFTIGEGQSLVNYVSFPAAINIANVHGLTIQAGRGKTLHKVTAEDAIKIDTAKTLVRVIVYKGDHFDLGSMTYTPATAK